MADSDVFPALASGLGSLLGSGVALASTQQGMGAVSDMTNAGAAQVAPYNFAGASYLGPVGQDLLGDSEGSKNIGNARINSSNAFDPNHFSNPDPVNFEDFASNYNTSEGAQYLMRTSQQSQDSSAAARGGLLSGANLRAGTQMSQDIASTDLLDQYKAHAAGQQQGYSQYQAAQQQDFSQRETAYQNLYGQEALGLQAGIASAGTYAQGARAIGSLAATQATNAQNSSSSFGSALGNIFTGLTKLFTGGA